MSKFIIVSRHPAAIEFIRANDVRFKDASVIESATPEDVRGAVVAGNLPLYLAALATQVVAVEFTGAPPRGNEYGQAEMIAAGARLATYSVTAVPTPLRKMSWNDGIGSRGRQSVLIIGKEDSIHQFRGSSIPGIVAVASSNYEKNGKWSNTTYSLVLASTAWAFSMTQSWEDGRYFDRAVTPADAVAELRKAGCAAPDIVVLEFLKKEFPKTMQRLEATASDIASVS